MLLKQRISHGFFPYDGVIKLTTVFVTKFYAKKSPLLKGGFFLKNSKNKITNHHQWMITASQYCVHGRVHFLSLARQIARIIPSIFNGASVCVNYSNNGFLCN
ncbi:hypothetical protein [Photobacterium phosphoreum]|uniref:hypothetical protein n=1 Tax=Photobacterium phosphoreum TaxID=659 RepID=UPI001E345D0F|nr:hypothetical protein [Photobacterium phosphoreum]MCD9480031.1 hypothetical protein [Photobacterium phosphoreum]